MVRTTVLAVAIAAIGLAGFLAWGRQLPLGNAAGDPPVGERGRHPSDRLAIAELPGATENYSAVDSLAGVAGMNILTGDELATYRQAGAGRVKVAVSNYADGKATVLLVRAASDGAARDAAERLAELQLGYGFRRTEAAAGVAAATLPPRPDARPGGRAHYVRDDIVVRVEFRGDDAGTAYAEFGTLLAGQLEALPADG
ncbi:hypothetical protein ACFS2C_26945 [Prauserella oleivorans]|uniref:LytR cell envelope-related transcriptional attenuator n=1 Tax=Prauserella oleivorans TaxID=1478153 RepID=A0ABW5WKR2_9PSEU